MKGDNKQFISWLQSNHIALNGPFSILDYIFAIDSFIKKRIDADTDLFDIIRGNDYDSLHFIQSHYYYKKANARYEGLYDDIVDSIFLFCARDILLYDEYFSTKSLQDGALPTTLYIHKANIICQKHGHPIECVSATVYGINKEEIAINANYCKICRRLFISHLQFTQLKERYTWLIGDFQYVDGRFETASSSFSDTSPLMLCGYNVRARNLTQPQRQRILAAMMACHVLSKPQIIKYIEGFITLNGSKKSLQSAVAKWEADLEFVRGYRFSTQKNTHVTQIEKYDRLGRGGM